MTYQVPAAVLDATFKHLRGCGGGRRECQALWVSPWAVPTMITEAVHPVHTASAVGFEVDDRWLTQLWTRLADEGLGVRVQIHTHPGAAYHSTTDDAFPLLRSPGFLSLVVPRFAQGSIGFDQAYLAEVQPDGAWREVPIRDHLEIV